MKRFMRYTLAKNKWTRQPLAYERVSTLRPLREEGAQISIASPPVGAEHPDMPQIARDAAALPDMGCGKCERPGKRMSTGQPNASAGGTDHRTTDDAPQRRREVRLEA